MSLRGPLVSASLVLGLQVYTNTSNILLSEFWESNVHVLIRKASSLPPELAPLLIGPLEERYERPALSLLSSLDSLVAVLALCEAIVYEALSVDLSFSVGHPWTLRVHHAAEPFPRSDPWLLLVLHAVHSLAVLSVFCILGSIMTLSLHFHAVVHSYLLILFSLFSFF